MKLGAANERAASGDLFNGRLEIQPGEARQIEQLNELSFAVVASRCLHVVADFGVADQIGDLPETPEALARKVGMNADALARILRLLSWYGVFEERGGRFAQSPLSRLLRSDHPRSQRPWVRQVGTKLAWTACRNLDHSARTGEPSLGLLDPPGLFPYLAAHPDEAAMFDAGMSSKARGDIVAIVGAYDFAPFAAIGDIGGGRGHLLAAVLETTPGATGVLFDQPFVIKAAEVTASERLKLVGGDFFAQPLPVCDCYILMNIIHDWTDEDSIAILKAVRKAAPVTAKLLLCELLLPERSRAPYALLMDIGMLFIAGGRERKLSEYKALLQSSGWRLDRTVPTNSSITIIESSPV